MNQAQRDELLSLLGNLVEGTLTAAESSQLTALLESSTEASDYYAAFMALHAHLLVKHNLVAELGKFRAEVAVKTGREEESPTAARSVSEESTHHAPRDVQPGLPDRQSPGPAHTPSAMAPRTPQSARHQLHHAERDGYSFARSVREAVWHPIALLLIVGFVFAGTLAYVFSTRPVERPTAQRPTPAVVAQPAAKLVGVTDVQWAGPFSPDGDTLKAGQRLMLKRGSAEIVFNKQARVIFEAPADFVITDAAACQLSSGKVTAHVPEAARGFAVRTPDGTVTDLGTEFGVYVETGVDERQSDVPEEQQETGTQQDGQQPAVTEVHVFKGKVELAQGLTDPKSKIGVPATAGHPKSKILSAGQAVTISDNKVQALPAADPFKFALDKLQGKPRKVLLSEDFETYDVGNNVQAIGPWTVQSGTRKGQGIRIFDAPDMLSQYKTAAGDPYPNLTPSPPTGGRFVFIACASPNRPETFPILAREIDGKLLARNGQVLIEFDILPNSGGPFEPSLALAAKVEHTAGIELGRDAEGKKIEWLPYQCYRLRLLLDVMDGSVRGVRADRLHWRGPQGWMRDLTFVPAAKCDWTTPPRYVIFGFPVVSGTTPGNIFWLDNVRIEVISEK